MCREISKKGIYLMINTVLKVYIIVFTVVGPDARRFRIAVLQNEPNMDHCQRRPKLTP